MHRASGAARAPSAQLRPLSARRATGMRAPSRTRAGPPTDSKTDTSYDVKVTGAPFTVGKGQLAPVLGASLGLVFRLGTGALVAGYKPSLQEKKGDEYSVGSVAGRSLKESSKISTFKRPAQPLIMYEFDACPFCKKVREMCSYLDIDCIYRPCPQGSPNHRPEAVQKSGKSRFPFMEDPNTGKSMLESDDIIKYLADTYGDGTVPLALRLGFGTVLTAGLGTLGRAGRGGKYRKAKTPKEPLVIWGYEPSPFVRLVRERLTELEIPHLFKTAARGSPKRQEMFDQYGKFQVPFMQDPNTGVAMFESGEIINYLESTYAETGMVANAQ